MLNFLTTAVETGSESESLTGLACFSFNKGVISSTTTACAMVVIQR